MILGTGIDLVDVSRFREMPRKDRLAERILTEKEHEEFLLSSDQGKFLARAWAVKEAVSKSFGTGIAEDVVWKNIQLSKSAKGQPLIAFGNELGIRAKGCLCNVSISHDGDQLIAIAVLSIN